MTTNDSLSFQPHSKKQKTNHDSSGSGGVAHDDRHIMNLESTPDTRVCGGQEDAGDLLSHQIQHSVTPSAGIELFKETMNTLRSSLFSADDENNKIEKAIGKLSVDDETGLDLARSLVMVLKSFVESEDSKNKTIKELEAKIERLEKELAESKSAEPVVAITEHEKSPTAEQLQLEYLTKVVDVMWSDFAEITKDIEGLRSKLTQLKEIYRNELTQLNEMRSLGQIDRSTYLRLSIKLSLSAGGVRGRSTQ